MAEEKLASRFKEQIEKGVVGRDTSLYGQFFLKFTRLSII